MEDIEVWKQRFVDRRDWIEWMNTAIAKCDKGNVTVHIYGVGMIGKTTLLQHWRDTLESTIYIDFSSYYDLHSRLNVVAEGIRYLGCEIPRFDLLSAIKKRLLDGVEPPTSERRRWLLELVGLVPVVGTLVDVAVKLVDAGKGVKRALDERYGGLGEWLKKSLGDDWGTEMLRVLWRNPDRAVVLMMDALREDVNTWTGQGNPVLVFLIDTFEILRGQKRQWRIRGRRVSEAELWHKFLTGLRGCIGVSAGRDSFDDDWCSMIGMQQKHLSEFDEHASRELLEDRDVHDSTIQDSVARVSRGHPGLMDLICDGIRSGNIKEDYLETLEAEQFEDIRIEIWSTMLRRVGNLRDYVEKAALLPYFNRETLSVVADGMPTEDWRELIRLSFVMRKDEQNWRIHNLTRDLIIAEIRLHREGLIKETIEKLEKRYTESRNAVLLGLAVSVAESVSEDFATDTIHSIVASLRSEQEYDQIATALRSADFKYTACVAVRNELLGIYLMDLGRFDEAEMLLLQALATQRADTKKDLEFERSYVATILYALGEVYRKTGRHIDAEKCLSEALEIQRELVKATPNTYEGDLAASLERFANLFRQLERYIDAEKMFAEAIDIYRELVKSDSASYQSCVARSLGGLAILRRMTGEYEDAEDNYIEALRIYRELEKSIPRFYRVELAVILNNLGTLYAKMGKHNDAEQHLIEALQVYRELAKSTHEAHRLDLAMNLNNLGDLYREIGKHEDAEKYLTEALEINRELVKSAPGAHLPNLAMNLNNLGELYRKTGKHEDAEKYLTESLEIQRELAKTNPEAYRSILAKILNNFGNLYIQTVRHEDAEKCLAEALEIQRELAKANPEAHRPMLATVLNNLGFLYVDTGRHRDAEVSFGEALKIYRYLVEHVSSSFETNFRAVITNLVGFYMEVKNLPKREAIRMVESLGKIKFAVE